MTDPNALEHQILQLKSGDEAQRRAALRALVTDDTGAHYVKQSALEDPSPDVRRDAVGWLGVNRRDDPGLIDLYLHLLDDPAPRVRGMALYAMQQTRVRDVRIWNALAKALADDDAFVRQKAVESLHKSGYDEALPLLLNALTTAPPGESDRLLSAIRYWVIEAGENPTDPAPLIDIALNANQRLARPDSSLWLVSEILSIIPDPSVIPAMMQIINHNPTLDLNDGSSTSVRALRDLRTLAAKLGYDPLIPHLQPYLKSDNPRIRISAICAFGVLGGDRAYVKLRPMMHTETHPEVRAVLNLMMAAVSPPNPIDTETRPTGGPDGENVHLPHQTRPVPKRRAAHVPTQPYTLQLVSIICDQQQEADGDETYIVLEGQVIWSVENLKRTMLANPARNEAINQYNFERCAFHGIDGWQNDTVYAPAAFRFPGLADAVILQVFEADGVFRGGDDFIGQMMVTPVDAQHEHIRTTLDGANARYTLTYRVTLD